MALDATEQTDAPAPVQPSKIAFLDLLRGAAPILVLYDHLAAIWPNGNARSWRPTESVRDWVTTPFGIIQDFGWLGVALFFLISGFIIPHVAFRESAMAFGIKRVMRIYPPLWASIVLILVLEWVRSFIDFQTSAGWSFGEVVHAMLLTNYFRPDVVAVSGVAWTLAIEMTFYTVCLVGWPLLKRRPELFVLTVLGVIALWIQQARDHGAMFFQVLVSFGYLPVLLLGTALYLRWSKRISTTWFVSLSVLCWLTFVYYLRVVQTGFLSPSNSYGVSVGFAYAIFVIALLLNDHITLPRIAVMASNISYSLYLTHGVVGFLVLDVLVTKIGFSFTLSLGAAVAVSFLTAYASWRFVERPSQRAARLLLSRRDG